MSVCNIHCNKTRLLTLKKDEIERIFLQSFLHTLVTEALARLARNFNIYTLTMSNKPVRYNLLIRMSRKATRDPK